MSIVSIIALIAYIALTVFFVLMWARFILDLARTFLRQWRPRGIGLFLAESVFTITDPPIVLVRKVIPPLRVGGVALDFAWSIVMLACIILSSIAVGLIR